MLIIELSALQLHNLKLSWAGKSCFFGGEGGAEDVAYN